MLHGRSSDPAGRTGPQHDGDWLVQALPYLLHGGSNHGTSHPTFLPDVAGEHHRPVLWAILRLTGREEFPFLSFCSCTRRFFSETCWPALGSAAWYFTGAGGCSVSYTEILNRSNQSRKATPPSLRNYFTDQQRILALSRNVLCYFFDVLLMVSTFLLCNFCCKTP